MGRGVLIVATFGAIWVSDLPNIASLFALIAWLAVNAAVPEGPWDWGYARPTDDVRDPVRSPASGVLSD
jgi:hypothetical protein